MAGFGDRFGVREICDVAFKALNTMVVGKGAKAKTFKPGQPVFYIETATTSNTEQATNVVYAQGGKGYNRLISWEGEKTLTFTVTDALMSPMGMSVLTGAGLIDAAADDIAHVHVTYDVTLDPNGVGTITLDGLNEELGLDGNESLQVCTDVDIYGTVLNSAGAAIDYVDSADIVLAKDGKDTKYLVTVDEANPFKFTIADQASKTVKLDFYLAFSSGVKTISIEPGSFGGYFYIEADTLFRDETTGKDKAAVLVFPKVKVQSAFTFTMAATGDPSTFDFVMDVFPAYTKFNRTKKVLCDMQIVEGKDVSDQMFHEHIDAESHTNEATDLP